MPSPATTPARYLQVQRTARYYVLGQPSERTRELWFVLHGYGQLAHYFIRHFDALDDGTRVIVAPEALSRFYLGQGQYDRVGASWMTKEDRLQEIDDQAAYLNALYRTVCYDFDESVRINVLGFSQGTATAWRWLSGGQCRYDNLILWGGAIPLDFTQFGRLKTHCLFLAVGSQDEYVTEQRMTELHKSLAATGIPHEMLHYQGGHTLPEEALQELLHLIERVHLAR